MARYVLVPTTDAENSDPFIVNSARGGNAQVTAPGLVGEETVKIQKISIPGVGWDYYLNGELQQITENHSGITIYGPGKYRAVKTETSIALGVEVSTDIDP